nr:phage minor tail protein L [uncultured Mediterranean phage uvMED]
MATFPSITPTYTGFRKTNQPNTRTTQFGDGYQQRVQFGLNQNPKLYSLTFNVSETDSDTIETFLDARAEDQDSFTFTPPAEASSSKFICKSWTKSIPYNNRAIINATFVEVFEP